jgi:hypothetical protein
LWVTNSLYYIFQTTTFIWISKSNKNISMHAMNIPPLTFIINGSFSFLNYADYDTVFTTIKDKSLNGN